jgi:hypothetical protein
LKKFKIEKINSFFKLPYDHHFFLVSRPSFAEIKIIADPGYFVFPKAWVSHSSVPPSEWPRKQIALNVSDFLRWPYLSNLRFFCGFLHILARLDLDIHRKHLDPHSLL